MSIARRETKWNSRSTACAGQARPPVQRSTTSPSARAAWLPQAGQVAGGVGAGRPSGGRRSASTSTTCGITSPARWMTTVSPSRASSRATSSQLCSVAWVTTTPPTVTGSILARGVSAPVRPTCTSIRSSTVVARSAGNFHAVAQRGARPAKPRRACQSSRSSLYTTPSMS